MSTKSTTAILFFLFAAPIAFASPGHILRAQVPVSNEYIVQLKSAPTPAVTQALMKQYGGRLMFAYDIIDAFVAQMTPGQAMALSYHPEVAVVEENAIISSDSMTTSGLLTPDNPAAATQPSRWGLDRIDQASPTAPRTDNTYTYCASGTGVRIYIMDTGVYPGHPDFGGRVDPDSTDAMRAIARAGSGTQTPAMTGLH